jgi:hypothetical protein
MIEEKEIENKDESYCGKVFSERLQKDIKVLAKKGESCAQARKRVEAQHKIKNKGASDDDEPDSVDSVKDADVSRVVL